MAYHITNYYQLQRTSEGDLKYSLPDFRSQEGKTFGNQEAKSLGGNLTLGKSTQRNSSSLAHHNCNAFSSPDSTLITADPGKHTQSNCSWSLY